jgi:hypothetical protein
MTAVIIASHYSRSNLLEPKRFAKVVLVVAISKALDDVVFIFNPFASYTILFHLLEA